MATDDGGARESDVGSASLVDDVELSGLPPQVADALLALRHATDVLTGVDVLALDGSAAMVLAAQVAVATSRLRVARVRVLPVIDSDGRWATSGTRSFPVWVAHHHHVSVRSARADVRLGRALRDDLPGTAAAAASGDITAEHAQVLATYIPTTPRRRAVLSDPDAECNETFLVHQARSLPVDHLRVVARRWAACADPDADDRGYVDASDRGHLYLSRLPDGYHLTGQLTLDHGQALATALAAITPVPAADDTRTSAQRRAQALADLARLTLDHGLTGAGRAARPRISVLVDHPTFTELARTALARTADMRAGAERVPGPSVTSGRTDPLRAPEVDQPHLATARTLAPIAAVVTGRAVAGGPQYEDGGPVPRVLLDRLACDSEIHRVIFGPESEVLDVGRTRRTFTHALRAAIIARDKHCRYPTCTAPPAISEGHHIRHWARDHGATSTDNGILLCWHHHDLVHRRGITIYRRQHTWIFLERNSRSIDPDDDLGPPSETRR